MPIPAALIAFGMMGAGAGASAMGAFRSAQAQKRQLDYESAVSANNAQVAQWQADQALYVGAMQEQGQRLKTAAFKSDQRAALAAAGVDLGSGSATEILATTDVMGERDALTIRDNAMREAWGYEVQKTNLMSQAAAQRAVSRSIKPGLAAATSLLSSGGQVAASWYNYSKVAS